MFISCYLLVIKSLMKTTKNLICTWPMTKHLTEETQSFTSTALQESVGSNAKEPVKSEIEITNLKQDCSYPTAFE